MAAGGPSSQPLANQNSTWGRKCICRVALFFIPIFSIHFDFILWTYCMSRWRTRAAPWEGGENEAKDSELRSEKTQLDRESKLVSVKRALIFKQEMLSDASIQRALGGSVHLPLCTRTALYIHASSVSII